VKRARHFAVAVLLCLGYSSASLGYSSGRSQAFRLLCTSAVAATAPADTEENTLATCTVPANAMGLNGQLHIVTSYSYTNSANDKTVRVRFSGGAGTIFSSDLETTSVSHTYLTMISNRGATNSQVGSVSGAQTNPYAASGGALVTAAVDTTAATTVVITCQKETGAESCVLEKLSVELIQPIDSGSTQVIITDPVLSNGPAASFSAECDITTAGCAPVFAGAVSITSTATSGSCTLNGASPSVCTATVTAATDCVCASVGATAVIAAQGCAVGLAATTLTITSANGATNAVNYHCF